MRRLASLFLRQAGRKESGMALVLTLACISFLVALTLQLMTSVDRQWSGAMIQREEARLDALALGGLQVARAALALDQYGNDFDSFFDQWNTLDSTKIQALAGDGAQLSVLVADLGGRLQVNALAGLGQEMAALGARTGTGTNTGASSVAGTSATSREARALQRYRGVWRRFLASGRFAISPEDIHPLLDALADWVDKDHNERPLGAEGGYYQTQDPVYAPRNGPIRFVEELLLVRGMTRALLYGDAEHEGIEPYITVLGNDGMINPNTAPLPVLLALLPDMSEENGKDLLAFRSNRENRAALASSDWLSQVRGLPADLGGDMPLLTVKSRYFAIQVAARRDQFRRVGTGFMERKDSGEQNLMLWRID